MKPLLEIRNVSLSYHTVSGETKALSNISFDLMPGEFLAVVGPSGCGKSTLLNLICGMLPAEEGTILMNGIPPSPGDPRIGYMLQKDHLLEWRNIYRNVLLGLEIRREKTPEKLGGALIRTLALKPELLLLDEPFSALDYQTRLNVSDDIGRILKKEQKTAILVTHDISEAISMADRVVILSARPAQVARIVTIRLSLDERTPLAARGAPEFKSYFNLIWKELNQYA